jgi:hypothetical protein
MANERMTIVLNELEASRLRSIAQSSLRQPRDQARFILRQALGITEMGQLSQEMPNRGAMDSDPQHAAAVV